MVSVTVGAMKNSCQLYVPHILLPCNYKIKLVPELGSWVAPRDLVVWLSAEEGICYTQLMKGAELKKPLTISIHLPCSMLAQTNVPRFIVCSYSRIEISQENDLFFCGDALMTESSCS